MLPPVATPIAPSVLAHLPTEDARRSNLVREPVLPTEQTAHGARERPLQGDRDRSKGLDGQQEQLSRTASALVGDDGVDAVAEDGQQSGKQGGHSGTGEQTSSDDPDRKSGKGTSAEQLTEQEREKLRELKAREQEVRAHEQAHATVGGRYAGAPTYSFQQGPDGQRYAVGGEVSIDISPVAGDPQATIDKMEVVKRAALAPAEPSAQDHRVAAEALAQSNAARAELLKDGSAQARQGAEDENSNDVPAAATSADGVFAHRALNIEIYYLSRVVPPYQSQISALA